MILIKYYLSFSEASIAIDVVAASIVIIVLWAISKMIIPYLIVIITIYTHINMCDCFIVILAMIKVGNKRQAYMRIKTNMPYATPWSTLLETNVISTSIATDFLLFIWKSRNTCSSVVISISLRSKYLVTMAESSKSGITSKWNREG